MSRLIFSGRNGLGVLLLFFLGFSFSAQSQQESSRFTAAEVASLPQYCQDKLNGSGNPQRWASYIGAENWLHLHHFCFGLIYFSRASMDFESPEGRHHIGVAINEFNYVLRNWLPTCPFYPQAQMYKQQLEMMRDWN